MTTLYMHHRITAAPRRWQEVAARLAGNAAKLEGGTLYGLWRSQIGRPRDEITAITAWTAPPAPAALTAGIADIEAETALPMAPTLRPQGAEPPRRQGNYAFRWFLTPEADWPEFLDLCAWAWPGFEAAYDSQVIGLWRVTAEPAGRTADDPAGPPANGQVRSLLLTRRPDLAMWERSKLPQGAAESTVRDSLSRRYDLCTWTAVATTTLLTATDSQDTARWT
jgi:hypothetical protein